MFRALLEKFQDCLTCDVNAVLLQKAKLVLPHFSAETIKMICNEAEKYFLAEQVVLDLDTKESPIAIVGDIHGQFVDLIRIIQRCGRLPEVKYLFLGDIIDRGEFSLETALLIFLLKIEFPENVFLLRGNHEFETITRANNLTWELEKEYPQMGLHKYFFNTFSFLPLAAIINNTTVCLHGGIGPLTSSIDIIRHISKPIVHFNDGVINEVLWSDPSDECSSFDPSPRKMGYLYGEDALLSFLCNSHMIRLVRGHKYIDEGIQKLFGGRCLTVFSASNYTGAKNNRSGVLIMRTNGDEEVYFEPMTYLLRGCAMFITPDGTVFNNSNERRMIGLGDHAVKQFGSSAVSLRHHLTDSKRLPLFKTEAGRMVAHFQHNNSTTNIQFKQPYRRFS